MNDSKIRAIRELQCALGDFEKATHDLLDSIENVGDAGLDHNAYIAPSYPFKDCFEDVRCDIITWVTDAHALLESDTKSVGDLTMNELIDILDKRYKSTS